MPSYTLVVMKGIPKPGTAVKMGVIVSIISFSSSEGRMPYGDNQRQRAIRSQCKHKDSNSNLHIPKCIIIPRCIIIPQSYN